MYLRGCRQTRIGWHPPGHELHCCGRHRQPPADEKPAWPPVKIAANPLAAILAWIDRLDSLSAWMAARSSEIGLKDCTLVVDDQRLGKRMDV